MFTATNETAERVKIEPSITTWRVNDREVDRFDVLTSVPANQLAEFAHYCREMVDETKHLQRICLDQITQHHDCDEWTEVDAKTLIMVDLAKRRVLVTETCALADMFVPSTERSR